MVRSRTLGVITILIAFVVVGNAQTPSDVIAATLILEAGGEYSVGSMQAVHEVIINRSAKRSLSAAQVCLQPYQFSCWNSGSLARKLAMAQRHPRWAEACMIVASKPTNLTNGADHYHADHCDPYWNKSMTVTVVIGRHIFCKPFDITRPSPLCQNITPVLLLPSLASQRDTKGDGPSAAERLKMKAKTAGIFCVIAKHGREKGSQR